jgi:cobyrinic acid a,c-diamide synthase
MHPRIITAATKGGSGKTVLSLGLVAAWREKGYRIATFKKGPDFIDAGWLAFASNRPCYNLDQFMMDEDRILSSFIGRSHNSDLSIIEGNRGLYDGLDLEGCCSTAELAKLLRTPVLVILDVTMTTRTVAATLRGFQVFDPDLHIAGVILNRVAGSRQDSLIRSAIEEYCGIPVVGSVPKLKPGVFPERHMGLIPFQEREQAEKAVSWARTTVQENLDLEAVWKIAHETEDLAIQGPEEEMPEIRAGKAPRIGYIRDRAFWFYYPENLEQLERLGAVLVEIDAMNHGELPPLDALYIGGGFPETQAEALANNSGFRESLRSAVEGGLPVYAECGGLMYLGEDLLLDENTYPMAGVLPIRFELQKKPQGHGYTVMEVDRANPYYPVGTSLKGHEFHYSRPLLTGGKDMDFVFRVARGHGIEGGRDGICRKNLLATYTHIHAAGNPHWARSLFRAAVDNKR